MQEYLDKLCWADVTEPGGSRVMCDAFTAAAAAALEKVPKVAPDGKSHGSFKQATDAAAILWPDADRACRAVEKLGALCGNAREGIGGHVADGSAFGKELLKSRKGLFDLYSRVSDGLYPAVTNKVDQTLRIRAEAAYAAAIGAKVAPETAVVIARSVWPDYQPPEPDDKPGAKPGAKPGK